LLSSAISSSLAAERGFNTLPYAQFSPTATVAQSLRPFPQYGDIFYQWAPLGKTRYDSVQIKVNKRYSHGFDIRAGFTYSKEQTPGTSGETGATASLEAANVITDSQFSQSLSALSRPFTAYIAPGFAFPKLSKNTAVSMILRDWRVSAVLQYASGLPIRVPISNSGLYSLIFQNTYASRGSSASFFTKDINGSSVNPMADFVLNPDAWADPEPGQISTLPAYLDKYRFKRRPSEQISIGRSFRIRENLLLSVRADFQNILNRVQMSDPAYVNAGATQVKDDDDVPQSGFGYINYRTLAANPRNGQIVVRLQF